MPKSPMADEPGLYGDILKFEAELGLPPHWYFELAKESHWSFVIKLHAMFEAAVTHLLEVEVEKPGLQRFVARLNLGGQFGKLRLAENLGALEAKHVKLIAALSAVRNAC